MRTCTASGFGNINDTVNLPVGASVTYTASAAISAAATGSLSSTATVTPPGGVTDPNQATTPPRIRIRSWQSADLQHHGHRWGDECNTGWIGDIHHHREQRGAHPMRRVLRSPTLSPQHSPSRGPAWARAAARATSSFENSINNTVNLPAGGSVTYTASATISASATGSLSNTATVTAPAGVTDPTPGNNSATDTDTLAASADLAITMTDGVTTAVPGGSVTYTITASNAGPSNATGATVADALRFPSLPDLRGRGRRHVHGLGFGQHQRHGEPAFGWQRHRPTR